MHHDPGVPIARRSIEIETADGLTLRGDCVTGPGRPKGIVIVAHGYGEHAGRYDDLIHALAASRFATFAVDQRGHGRSDGERAYEPELSHYVDDFGLVVEQARADFPGKPCYLIGHSLGGLVALSFAYDHQSGIEGLVLLAPALRYWATIPESGDRLLHRVAKRVPRLPLLGYVPGVRSRKRSTEVEAWRDPLVHHGWIRAGTIACIHDGGAAALARAKELAIPILTMHGDADKVIDPAASVELYSAIGVREHADNSLITWPGMRHELLNEADADQVVGVILGWLNGHYTAWRILHPTGTDETASAV